MPNFLFDFRCNLTVTPLLFHILPGTLAAFISLYVISVSCQYHYCALSFLTLNYNRFKIAVVLNLCSPRLCLSKDPSPRDCHPFPTLKELHTTCIYVSSARPSRFCHKELTVHLCPHDVPFN